MVDTMIRTRRVVRAGDTFSKLTAVEPGPPDRGHRTWVYRCRCGSMVTYRVTRVAYYLSRHDWASCPECFRGVLPKLFANP